MKDPREEQAKKNHKLNEWKNTIDAQVNEKIMKKQQEIEFNKAQDLKEEERLRRHYEEQRYYQEAENFVPEPKESSYTMKLLILMIIVYNDNPPQGGKYVNLPQVVEPLP